MAQPVVATKALAVAADADGICETQTPAGAGNLTINGAKATGGVASLSSARQVLFTFAGADAARTFVIYGTADASGIPIQETVSGANSPSTSVTTLNYYTVTRISVDAAMAGALTVGTNGVGASQWYNVNFDAQPFNLSISTSVSGTVNYTIQYTYDNFWGTVDPSAWTIAVGTVTAYSDPILVAQTAAGQTTINDPITGWRVLINSGTGTVTARAIQAGLRG